MALAVIGGLVVQTSSTNQPPQVVSFGTLKKCGASIVGGEDQSEMLRRAGEGVVDGVRALNLRGKFDFNSSTDSDATIVDGTATYDLGSDTFAVRAVQIINSDGDPHRTLEYIDWDDLAQREDAQTRTGMPEWWTIRSQFDDEELILYPTPDSGTASDYTLRITRFTRTLEPSSDSDVIDAPRELTGPLCWHSKWYVSLHVNGADHPTTLMCQREAELQMRRFKSNQINQPDELMGTKMLLGYRSPWPALRNGIIPGA